MGKLNKADKLSVKNKEKLLLSNLIDRSNSSESSPCNNCYNVDFAPEAVDYLDLESVVVKMITNYQANQYQRITNPSTTVSPIIDDARSVYFSLNKLKSFIFEIERLCCERGCNEVLGELGIRFYYGAYNNTGSLPTGVKPEYKGKHTLVLVPTYSRLETDGTISHVDFSPDRFTTNDDGTLSCVPESLDEDTTYTDSTSFDTSMEMHTASLKIKKRALKKEKKVMVLVGGLRNKPQKITKSKKSSDASMNKVASVLAPAETMMNHGDLIPPPSKDPSVRYKDATLLNC